MEGIMKSVNDISQELNMYSKSKILQFDNGCKYTEAFSAKESSLSIFLNNRHIVTLACSNDSKQYLSYGFLASEGFIGPEEVEQIKIDRMNDDAIFLSAPDIKLFETMPQKVITPGLGKGTTFIKDKDFIKSIKIRTAMRISPNQVFSLMKKLGRMSSLYKITHGVHNSAICTPVKLILFQYDLGRHNAVDKLYGQCLFEKIPLQDKVLITSGRVSSEIIIKTAKMGVPILISRASPTDKAINIAKETGITLIARARGRKMSVYSHQDRISLDR